MRNLVLILGLTLCCTGLRAAERSLADYKAIYDAEAAKIDVACRDSIEKLLDHYSRQLGAAKEKCRENGDLAAVLSLNKEIERFEADRSVPTETPGNTHQLVAQAQSECQVAKGRAEIEKSRQTLGLSSKYVSRLEILKREFVKGDKLDEALAVDSEIKRVEFVAAEAESRIPRRVPEARAERKPVAPPRLSTLTEKPKGADFDVGGERESIAEVASGVTTFHDRDYTLGDDFPKALVGMRFIRSSCLSGMARAICTREGTVYAVTHNGSESQQKYLEDQRFRLVKSMTGSRYLVLRKKFKEGETIAIPRWGFLVF